MRVAPTLEAGQAASDRDIAVDFLRSIIGARGAGRGVPSAEARNALLAMVAAWQAPADAPADLHGTPCAQSAPDWHLHNLLNLAEQAHPDVEATFARRLYHARWLGYLLFGDRDEFRPVVTILIPVYNRARLVLDAIESCLAQTWRPLEILVVDDGSTDDLAGALAGFSAAVRLIRKDNGGVSSARNLGIQAAKGDLIHFLDSDNLLMPPSVARKVEAFARIADAEFCRNLAEVQDSAALPPVPRA